MKKAGGLEDRLVQLRDRYYLTYTGYNKKDAQLCLAGSMDLIHWKRLGVILSKRGNEWLFYYGGADKYVGVASAKPLPQ